MLLFSRAKPKLNFVQLSAIEDRANYEKSLKQITLWFTEEWGYLHDKEKTREQAIEDRLDCFSKSDRAITLVFFGKLMIGAFRIEEKALVCDRFKASEIWFMYVDRVSRELGIGHQIIREIQRVLSSKDKPDDMLLLETLKPSLNRFYKQSGAKWICEGQIGSEPTDVLRIDIHPRR